jgi:hypothetical protein
MRVGFRLASCAVPTLLGFLLAGCATQSWLEAMASAEKPGQDGQDGLMRVAADIEAQGQMAAALPIYERAAASSSNAAAQLRLADAYMRAGKTDQAIQATVPRSPAPPTTPMRCSASARHWSRLGTPTVQSWRWRRSPRSSTR